MQEAAGSWSRWPGFERRAVAAGRGDVEVPEVLGHRFARMQARRLQVLDVRDEAANGCRLLQVPGGEASADDEDIAQPDLVFISNERVGIIGEKNVQGAPDLVVEILSDSTRRTDEIVKRGLYERFGVREYWLIDPKRRTVLVFRRSSSAFGPAQTLSAGDILTSPLFPGFEMRVGGIFE